MKLKKEIMGVMLILLGVSLVVAIVFLGAFIWSVKSGQYEDDYTPAHSILFEENLKEDNYSKDKNKNDQ